MNFTRSFGGTYCSYKQKENCIDSEIAGIMMVNYVYLFYVSKRSNFLTYILFHYHVEGVAQDATIASLSAVQVVRLSTSI